MNLKLEFAFFSTGILDGLRSRGQWNDTDENGISFTERFYTPEYVNAKLEQWRVDPSTVDVDDKTKSLRMGYYIGRYEDKDFAEQALKNIKQDQYPVK